MVLFALLITLYTVFREKPVQTLMARVVSVYLSNELKTEVRIRGFDFSLFHGLKIEDVSIKDRHNEYLFRAHALSVVPRRFNYHRRILRIRSVFIDQGEFQLLTHKGDSVLNLNFIIDYFSSRDTTKKVDTTKGKPWHLSVSSVKLNDTRFHFEDENKLHSGRGMDYANIDVSHINLQLSDFFPDGDTLHANIKNLSAVERSGFTIRSMSGKFQVGPCFLKADGMKLKTINSDIDLDFAFLYNSWNAYTDFLDKVTIHAQIRPSILDLQDIGAFAPVMYAMKNPFHIQGELKGKVDNFRAKNFSVAFGDHSFFKGNISANGLPDVEETFVDLEAHDLNTCKKDIENLNLPEGAGRISLPALLENAGIIDLKGNFTGFYNDFVANVRVKSGIGDVNTDLKLTRKKGIRTLEYNGQLDATALDLGVLLNNPGKFGKITLRADINGKGFRLNDAALTMNVHVDSVVFNKYLYRQIGIRGSLVDKKFDGKLDILDPQLILNFNGLVDFRDSIPSFKFKSEISKANLFALNFLKRDSILNLSTRLDVDFTGNDIDNIEGSIKISDFSYREGRHVIRMNELTLNTFREADNRKSYHLRSDFADADFAGEFSFRDMIPSLGAFTNNYLYSFRLADSLMHHKSASNQVLNFHVLLKNTDPVAEVFVPFIRAADGTRFDGQYNEEKGVIEMKGSSTDITVRNMHFSDWFIQATSRIDNLHVETGSEHFYLKKKSKNDSVEIRVDDLKLASDLRRDSILYRLTWLGEDPGSSSRISGLIDFNNSPVVAIKTDNFVMYLDHRHWNIDSTNLVLIDTNRVSIHNMNFFSKEQHLDIDGILSHNLSDTLHMKFSNVDISHLDKLFGSSYFDIDGILSGDLKVVDIYDKLRVLSGLRIEKFRFNSEDLGTADLSVLYDNDNQRFDVHSKIIATGNIGTNIPMDITGTIALKGTEPRLDLGITLKNLKMKMLNPFVSSFMSQISGFASGDLTLSGPFNKPVLRGEVKMMRAECKINYLNIPYSFSDVVTFDTNRIVFNNINIFDSLGNKAVLNGKITHSYFADLRLDLGIDYDDFSAFRNTYAQNNIFYGTARATGNVSITGPLDNINIEVRAKTGNGTHVIIPINMTAEVGQSDYIIFSNPGQDTLNVPRKVFKRPASGLSLNIGLLVSPTADVEVFLPDQLGNIRASGMGNLTMEMTPTTSFSLLGTVTLQKGSFLLALKNLLRLNFIIREGGRITWTGDPVDANISLNAVYKTRVPLGGLTADQDKAKLRIPVDCIIRMSGRLMNPDITFGMELPNVDEEIKSLVYGAIDTSNASEMNEQMMYVLVMNQFRPVATVSSKFNVGTTSLSLLTNQVSSLFSKISKNVHVGINYKPGTQNTTNEFDVSVSTQLLNDRLLIDGLFGMSSNYTSSVQKANTIVGDINIDYILTKNRRWRLRAFNRTNVIDPTLNNNAPYTQGVGISFQRDFNTFGDLFKREKKKEGGGRTKTKK